MSTKSSFFKRSSDDASEQDRDAIASENVEIEGFTPHPRRVDNRDNGPKEQDESSSYGSRSDSDSDDSSSYGSRSGSGYGSDRGGDRGGSSSYGSRSGSDRNGSSSYGSRSGSGFGSDRGGSSSYGSRSGSDRGGSSSYSDRNRSDSRGGSSNYGSRSGSDRGGERGGYAQRAPRGERIDFRKDDNRRPDEDRDAPENVIYGIHPVREAIEMGKAIEKVYFRRSSANDDARYGGEIQTHSSEAIDHIRQMLVGSSIICQDVPPEKLDRLSRRGNHQGVVAVMPAIDYVEFNDLMDRIAKTDIPALIVVVDSVTDVRNFGAISRSAECAGADAIIMSSKNSAPVNAEAMRSSAGALSIIPVCRVGSLRNSLKTLQMAGLQLVAATEKSGTIIFEADFTKPTVIVMGSEDKGISNEILKMCDARVSIPLLGKIDSLNVSAAAAVMLFEAVRQRFEAIE